MVKEEISSSSQSITLNLKGLEITEREVTKFGTGAHVTVPKEYLGKKVKIIFEGGENGN
jgi:hypothetical protein